MEADFGSVSSADESEYIPASPASGVSAMVAMVGIAAASAAVNEVDIFDTDNNNTADLPSASGAGSELTRPMSFKGIADIISRRNYGGFGQVHGTSQGMGADSSPALTLSIQDVRKFVFQVSRSDKRLMGGLRARTFSSQAFFSSFAVGLAIGSIVAILLRILTEVGVRVLPFYGK